MEILIILIKRRKAVEEVLKVKEVEEVVFSSQTSQTSRTSQTKKKNMLNKISIALIDESGNVIPVTEKPYQVEMKLDSAILDLWTESANRFKSITDEEERFARKFEFVNLVTNFLRENNGDEQPF